MTFDTPVTTLPFVGPKYRQLLAKLGIATVGDLLYHIPSRYVDLSKITPIAEAEPEETVVISATIESVKKVRLKSGKTMVTAQAHDESGSIQLTWFNQPFMEKSLTPGVAYRFAGEIEHKFGRWQMTSPTHEPASRPHVHTGRIVPVYPQTAGISSKWLRARIVPLLGKLDELAPEYLPITTRERCQLQPRPWAVRMLHAPEALEDSALARQRLAFDELLLLQLAALQRRAALEQGPAAQPIRTNQALLASWISALPFEPTDAQRRVVGEVVADLSSTTPMNRLVEGDVGSGKTVVAFLAAMAAVSQGFQVAVMAPTSVLANQHFLSFTALAESMPDRKPTVALRTAKHKSVPADITVGTHALIAEGVSFDSLGLVIVDEQHRFGVEQRATLMQKAGRGVHMLSMTATPIPRTLALTVYGDLDLSIIDQMPRDRIPVKTHVVPQAKRADMEGYLRQAMERGEQVYIICPLVEESDALQEVRAVTTEFERLQTVFPNHRLALLHGRMKPAEKDAVLQQFKDHTFDALVATPVVEVGIDVPNATIIVIEGAERFGLAQLHQLRGRVGRGSLQSYCFLLSDAKDASELKRLRYLEQETSGIRLAEIDLEVRGPGEVFGQRQSGLPDLKAADFGDVELIQLARHEAEKLMTDGISDSLEREIERSQKLVAMN
jgi:ATP-dependent DNA helicase RecG